MKEKRKGIVSLCWWLALSIIVLCLQVIKTSFLKKLNLDYLNLKRLVKEKGKIIYPSVVDQLCR